jgi:hypothetical protein
VSAAVTPVARDVLADHLGLVRLPARTAALLERAGEGPGTLESRTTTGSGSIEARTVDLVAERLTLLLDGIYDLSEQADLVSLTRALSGLGPGLTPTGDDLLVGIAAACQRLVAGGYWPAARGDSLVAALAEIGDTGTTAVAREMVNQAAAGRFPDALTSFVELLGDRETDAAQAQAAVERLAAIGAHSGADMLAGVVALAVRACREGKSR